VALILAEDLSRQLSESLQQKEHELVAAEAQLLKLSDQLSQCELHHMGLQRQLGEMTAEGTSHMQEITRQRHDTRLNGGGAREFLGDRGRSYAVPLAGGIRSPRPPKCSSGELIIDIPHRADATSL
jgi:hypothetical protein